jgi:DNA-binding winged helix-turn-helix (wHTH) protein/Tol biopolymer transport system component
VFELDLRSGELRKAGSRINLADQPFRILAVLLEHPGELVTRDELRSRVWPTDTFVDFEHGLNAAIKRLRDALGDSADTPRFIETVPKRGYRFVSSVEPAVPEDRVSSARDLAFAREAAGDVASMGNGAVQSTRAARSTRRAVAWLAGVVGALGIAATAFLALRGNADDSADRALVSMRLLLPGPPAGYINVFQFSPDGQMVVALVTGDPAPAVSGPSPTSVWVCDLSRGEWRRIAPSNTTADGFMTPVAWSPDGRSVLYQGVAGGAGELRVADVASSAVRSIARLEGTGASWSRESGILVGGRTLRLVSPESGSIQDLLPEDPAVRWRRWPSFLPDGRAYVFTQDAERERDRGVFVGRVGSTETARLIPIVSNAVVTRSGRLVYADRGTLLSVRLNVEHARTEGDPQSVTTGLTTFLGYTWFSVSAAGAVLVPNVTNIVRAELAMFDRTGKRERVLRRSDQYRQIELSPDQRRLAVEVAGQIGVLDIERGVLTPVTGKPLITQPGQPVPVQFIDPVWRPDGRVLAAAALGGDLFANLVLVDLGTREMTTVLRRPSSFPEAWSPDSRQLLVIRGDNPKGTAIWAVPVEKPDAAQALTPEAPFTADEAQLSPKGDWLAYTSNETDTFEIYLQSLHTPGERRRVSTDGGGQPRWRTDGRELFYLRLDGTLMAVPISASMEPGNPVPLFMMRPRPSPWLDEFVALQGGQRFIGIVPVASEDRASGLACGDEGCPALVMLTNSPALVTK